MLIYDRIKKEVVTVPDGPTRQPVAKSEPAPVKLEAPDKPKERKKKMTTAVKTVTADKEMISIRLDKEVLSVLRNGGPGWQTRLNEQLRKLILK